MTAALRLPPLGAPDLYWAPPNPVRALTGERMDVCAFIGVAPRGPARVPRFLAPWAERFCEDGAVALRSVAVPVESWTEYTRLFGAFEGPGLLPYAVASFFENGGVRAYVTRIVHDYRLPGGSIDVTRIGRCVASAPLRGLRLESSAGSADVWLRARNEGSWGNGLSASLSFVVRPIAIASSTLTPTGFVFERGVEVVPGATLRFEKGDGSFTLARIARVWEEWHHERGVIERHASFDAAVAGVFVRAEVVEGLLEVRDGDGRSERHTKLGLAPEHPRWIARVLIDESTLLYPGENLDVSKSDVRRTWYADRALAFDASLPTYNSDVFATGPSSTSTPGEREPARDSYADIVPDDFFDPLWTVGDECPGEGVHCLVNITDLSIVVAPDLYSPGPLESIEPVHDEGGAGAEFCECLEAPVVASQAPVDDLGGLRLDPATDLDAIIALQRRLIDLASSLESFVVLLDVPPGLSQRRILAWREQLHSMYAAAYHPWLRVSRGDDARDAAIVINPSAVAAGIIARRELERGVQFGPANEFARSVFDVADRTSPARHAELHQQAINVYMPERDGVLLTAARTLSPDASYRQLSVRRLMTMLRRVLYRQMQWAVFEPNDFRLRADIHNQLDAYLRQLFAANAFAGARAEDSFFVRCDDALNTQAVVDAGRLLCYVGVAPAEPLEFIVLQIARDGDGTLRVQG